MPRIFLLPPSLVVVECHFSQLRKAGIINLYVLNAIFSWDICSTFGVGDLSTIILVPLVLGQIIFQMFHPASSISMCKTRAPTKLWVLLGERLRLHFKFEQLHGEGGIHSRGMLQCVRN